ncbi:MAG TPA: alpha/beta hydrolase [Pseudonocardia sp.]|jgi:pimeloyl-ACP methyl ester carboxylesterase|nr:alpha/beta hydrolase [Pseudonocardia sp.]
MKVNYDRRGSGSPLVLLHGIGHRWQAWNPVLDLLAQRHEVIALDMPGFGESGPMPTDLSHSLEGSMQMLARVFDHLGIDHPHLAGNSLGGLITIEAASQGMVSSGTALSPAGFWGPRDRVRALATLSMLRAGARAPGPIRSALLENDRLRAGSLKVLYEHPERIDRDDAAADMVALRNSSAFAPTLREGRRFVWAGAAPSVPLTVAWSARDRVLPPRQAQQAARLLPNAHHVRLPGCGHVPMSDDPTLVARTILDTCERAEQRANPDAKSA